MNIGLILRIVMLIWFHYCYLSDDDFIPAGLGGMGHKSNKKMIPNSKFIIGWFQTGIF